MKHKSILIFALLGLFSCRELVQDKFPDFAPVPTINSILIVDSLLKVHVSMAGSIDTNQLRLVEDAEILLYVNEQFKETLTYEGDGIYSSNITVEPLKKYSCLVNVPGFETVSCTDSIPTAVQLSDILHIRAAGKNEEGLTYPAIQFTFANNPDKRLYFEAVIRLLTPSYGKLPLSKSVQYADLLAITDPVILNEGLPIAVFSNEMVTGQSYTMTLNYTTNSAGSTNNSGTSMTLYPLILELRAVSYDYYKYVKQQYLYEIGRYPSGLQSTSAVFPIYSNIKNAYGIFVGYSATLCDTIYPNQ